MVAIRATCLRSANGETAMQTDTRSQFARLVGRRPADISIYLRITPA